MRPRISAFRPGIPVAQGGADAFIGMIGLGVTEPGEMALITGSSHLHLGIAARPVHAPGVWGTYMDAVYPDKPIIEGGQTSTGSVIAWFKRHFAAQTTFDALNEEAANDRARAAKGWWCSIISRATARPIPMPCRAAPSPA